MLLDGTMLLDGKCIHPPALSYNTSACSLNFYHSVLLFFTFIPHYFLVAFTYPHLLLLLFFHLKGICRNGEKEGKRKRKRKRERKQIIHWFSSSAATTAVPGARSKGGTRSFIRISHKGLTTQALE